MIKPAAILACGLAVLAGCTTPPRAPKPPPPDWELSPAQQKATPTPPASPPEIVVPPAPPATTGAEWLALNRWSAERGFGAVRRVSATTPASYTLPTTNGGFIFTLGSQTAYWNGLALRLGFAPQELEGEPAVHTLDARKTLEPLLRRWTLPPRGDRVIVVDPGHGGANTGTRSAADGRFEKEFTLDWAFRLAKQLEAAGWRVFLTRTNDTDVSLAERVAFAEQHHADLFLSLHFNSAGGGQREQAGLETYCLTPTGLPSSLTRGYGDDASLSFPNNAYDDQNLQYAIRLHRALLAVNGSGDRGVRRARFLGVLRGQNRPAVLVEGGYLSNPAEARRIADPAHRQKLAEAIAQALE